jgi:hypothetical protein
MYMSTTEVTHEYIRRIYIYIMYIVGKAGVQQE